MPIVFFDTESTGIPDWQSPSESTRQPHIVEIAAVKVDDDCQIIDRFEAVVKPDGWVIPEDMIAIHGITNEYACDVGIPEREAVDGFIQFWGGALRIAHNTTFDNRIVRIATKRFLSADVQDLWHKGPYECTLCLSRPILKKQFGLTAALPEAYRAFTGKELVNAHRAMPDTIACMEVFFAIKNRVTQPC